MLTIAQLATEFGLSLRTLRFYEQRGLLTPARVGTTRLYSPRDKLRLEIIVKGKRLGLSISEIERLLLHAPESETPSDLVSGLSADEIEAKLTSTEAQIARLQEAVVQLRTTLNERRA